jgi:hypothetical protein
MKAFPKLCFSALLLAGSLTLGFATPSNANSILSTGVSMTAKECAEVFGCCVCRQRIPGMGCIDWQGC